jgi:hypothetical protein
MPKTLALLLLCSMLLIGCKTITLHPVTDKDIMIGGKCPEGYVCMSPDYIKNVMQVKLEEK